MIAIPERSYADIIDLPRPAPRRRSRISALGRAAQFAPFAALTGLEDELDETARLTDRIPERTEEDCALLNAQFHDLLARLHEQPEVTMRLFQADEKKPGGAFISVTGRIRRIDEVSGAITLTDGRTIPFGQVQEALLGTGAG